MRARRFMPLIASAITALLIATFVHAQPGIGITKTAPLAGSGNVANPLKITPCLNGSAYVSNGTTWSCATAGTTTGSGTLNYIAKWTPSGTALGSFWMK